MGEVYIRDGKERFARWSLLMRNDEEGYWMYVCVVGV